MDMKAEPEKAAEILKWYLGQVKRAKNRKQQLERRLKEINNELNAPIGGVGYSPLPRNGGTGQGAASIIMRIAEVEERIARQQEQVGKTIVHVMDIMDYLPEESTEREIMELKHIDCLKWERIQAEAHLSRSPCYEYYKKGIELLLKNKRVQKIVEDNTEAYDEYMASQKARKR